MRQVEINLRIYDIMIYYKNNPMPQTGNRYHQHFKFMFVVPTRKAKNINPITELTKYIYLAN